ncbi:Stress responsive A/B Barrel Domain protein [Caprobacter fermentans]|uniref:Stress responsive A/B Barrel Domain protein n=1 Tax=Caproicibacter fermentans TaxID=2576756 RepID=A0A6N8HVL9_9FIRM|nr:Dabb family protein [Caproicibacter fermentans]MVB09844.1 Stress responsive A/B Barrel Domain protein [Caproicibacter fermentans]
MIRHLVFWTLKPEEKDRVNEIAADLRHKFQALLGTVDGLEAIELGQNYNGGDFDLVLNCTFSTKEAERAYQTHPAHLAIKSVVHTLVCARASADYEI